MHKNIPILQQPINDLVWFWLCDEVYWQVVVAFSVIFKTIVHLCYSCLQQFSRPQLHITTMASCSAVLGLVLTLASLALTGVSFGSPWWLESKENATHSFHSGLWQQCVDEGHVAEEPRVRCYTLYGNGTIKYPSKLQLAIVENNKLILHIEVSIW